MPLPTDLFDYQLPPRLIAQTPAARRDASRLLVVDRAAHTLTHATFADLPQFLRPTDTLFRNNAAVLPARLHAQRPTGGAVECLLLRPAPSHGPGANTWWCLIRPGKKLPVGATFRHHRDFTGTILEKNNEGAALIRFETAPGETITAIANRLGEVPLPPYINRDAAHNTPATQALDRERYQTVYAAPDRQVAVAAPTAGLHFTPALLAKLAAAGIATADITLHVGLGTFRPIATNTVEEHPIHREIYEIPPATQRALLHPRGRRVAVGTTTVRTVEDFFRKQSEEAFQAGGLTDISRWLRAPQRPTPPECLIKESRTPEGCQMPDTPESGIPPGCDVLPIVSGGVAHQASLNHRLNSGKPPACSSPPSEHGLEETSLPAPLTSEASLYISPPFTFAGVDALITNFHQPRSTLLCLVAAFLAPGSTDGILWLREIYADAISRDYRFFSYGDAMLIV